MICYIIHGLIQSVERYAIRFQFLEQWVEFISKAEDAAMMI